jgi:hypothetical protein
MAVAEEKNGDAKAAATGLAAATDKLRASATWILGAFAAVGATFAAGLSLANIGKLSVDEPVRLGCAVLGIVVTVAAVVVAIAATVSVTANSRVSLSLLASSAFDQLRGQLDADEEIRGGYESVADLRRQVLLLRANVLAKDASYAAAYAATTDPSSNVPPENREADLAAATTALQFAQRSLATAESVKAEVLDVAAFERVKSSYDSSKQVLAGSAVAAALGIAMFAWGANPPAAATAATAGEVLPKTPSEVTLLFTDPSDALQTKLGKGCNLSAGIDAVAMTVAGETYQVATVKAPKCASIWLEVTPKVGQVVPRVAKKTDTKAAE